MPTFRNYLTVICSCILFLCPSAFAAKDSSALHWSANRTIWDRKNNRVELFGNAIIQQQGETLTADYATMNFTDRVVDAKGNCVYSSSGSVIYGKEMHLNLETRTGTVMGGRVVNDQFTLTGEMINKLGDSRYQTHNGTYSTCRDCPQAWTIQAGDVDLEFGEYAYMRSVTARVKDAPFFWAPYLIIPIKTARQTGLLFPKFSFNETGFNFVQPFFWAINRSSDMTLGAGDYGGRGFRGEWEGRYQISARSGGTANFFFLNDHIFKKGLSEHGRADIATGRRWALSVKQLQELPFGVDEKLKISDASDNLYTSEFNDIATTGSPALPSTLIFSHNTRQVSSYIAGTRYRNLLTSDPLRFDTSTVQALPTAAITTNEKFIFGSPVAAGVTVGATQFTRSGPVFDRDQFTDPSTVTSGPRLGQDPIRKGTRVSYAPSVYTTLRPWGTVSIVPRAEYRGYFYSFNNELPNLTRGYVLAKTDVFTQIERVYDTSDPGIPRIKHLIRPMFTYSLIPYVMEDYPGKNQGKSHPFLQQIEYSRTNNFTGYSFDSYDIVPRDESRSYGQYFEPLGHSLTYGYTTQLVRRRGAVSSDGASYQTIVEWKSGQTYNLRELKRPSNDRQPFSKAFSSLGFSFDPWNAGLNYEYFPYLPIDDTHSRHSFNSSLNYVFERGLHKNILVFERSIGLAYSWQKSGSQTSNLRANAIYSLSDYVTPDGHVNYDFLKPSRRWLAVGAGLRFQSPSQCWQLRLATERTPCDIAGRPGFCVSGSFDLALNLSGNGFSGVDEVANKAGINTADKR